jgi:phosphoribosylaminoimidazole carboxylase (NCAIR synthetase)
MKTVAFAAPFLRPNTVRFLRAIAEVPNIRLGLISHDSPSGLDPWLKQRIIAHGQMGSGVDFGSLAQGVEALTAKLGKLDRLLGMLEQLQVPLAMVRDKLDIPGMRTEAALNFRDKARMKERLRAAGLPCARHALVERPEEAEVFAREVGFPIVIKPPAGAGAVATFQVTNLDELKAGVARFRPAPNDPVLCEEFVRGKERSMEVISVDGRPVWHSLTHYGPTPLDVLENPWIQWTVLLPREVEAPEYDDAREVGFRALKVLGMQTGLSHMEWFRRPDGSVAIGEIAARPPGAQIMALMSYSTDRDIHRAWAELMIHGSFDPPVRKYAAGVAFLRGQGKQGGQVVAVHSLEEAQKLMGKYVVEVDLPKLGATQKSGYEGEGYAIVRAPETATVRQALWDLITRVRIELG